MTDNRETYQLRALIMRGVRISWEIPHSRQRAAERNVSLFEAERVVKFGSVTRVEFEVTGQERWRISGWDADDRPVDVVVKPISESVIRVVTVIRTDE